MKRAIVIPNLLKDPELSLTESVISELINNNVTVYIDREYGEQIDFDVNTYSSLPIDADFIVVIGGDGSFIDASRIALELDIPLVGINLGKVGYLATIDPERLDLLSRIKSGEYKITDRMLLSVCKIGSDGDTIACERNAVNDIVISHDSFLGLSDIKIESKSGDQVQYRADGVIFATPAGSTAYSLSAGGPIISHNLDSITVTPVCQHSFFNRSIIYGPEEKIKVTNMGEGCLNISVDGRLFSRLGKRESCILCRSEKRIKLISLEDSNLFSTLTKKIKLLHDLV